MTRRSVLKAAAAAVAAPYVITSTALGNADTPPASERVALGHIGVGNQGGDLFRALPALQGPAERGRRRRLQGSPRRPTPRMIKGKAYGDFRELLARNDIDAVVDRHARPLARADRHRRRPGEEGRLRREAAGREHRAGPRLPEGVRREQPHLPVRHAAAQLRRIAASAANWSAAGGSARCTRSR